MWVWGRIPSLSEKEHLTICAPVWVWARIPSLSETEHLTICALVWVWARIPSLSGLFYASGASYGSMRDMGCNQRWMQALEKVERLIIFEKTLTVNRFYNGQQGFSQCIRLLSSPFDLLFETSVL